MKLLQDAGEAEDSHWILRYRNHYHDPTLSLMYAGLKNGTMGWSNLEWAQYEGNEWTWKNANRLFLAGLNFSSKAERDEALGDNGRYLFVSNSFEDTVSAIPLDNAGLPAQAAPTSPTMLLSASSGEVLGTVVLSGFPPGGRVSVDGEFPRWEEERSDGMAVSFPAGTRTLSLVCPGYAERWISVTVGPGETVTLDGTMAPQ